VIRHIPKPTVVMAAGNKPKQIHEYIGRVNSETTSTSIALMRSPGGWIEPGQTPKFDEYTLVLKGKLRVQTKTSTITVAAGEAVIVEAGEWIQYSTPDPEGAEYVAVCLPAFSPETVNRDS